MIVPAWMFHGMGMSWSLCGGKQAVECPWGNLRQTDCLLTPYYMPRKAPEKPCARGEAK